MKKIWIITLLLICLVLGSCDGGDSGSQDGVTTIKLIGNMYTDSYHFL